MDISGMHTWGVKYPPLIIAGPCSAESKEQLYSTAASLKTIGIDIIRAGVWKPRTRPGNFEGAGDSALNWISEIRDELGLKFATEVATPLHVEKALKANIDVFWVGARTTANSFAVQELAEAIKGVDKPVLVKNPLNPDISLWLGALERINRAGVTKLAAVHRGFSSFQKSRFRNPPTWHLAIELKSELPQMPLICDPSHIAGERSMIMELCQKAMDLDYDGLMVEVHIRPEEALSDTKQQITPDELKRLIDGLKIRKRTSDNVRFLTKLEELREKIDLVDQELLETLSARMKLVDEIGFYKKENNVTVFQLERWKYLLKTRSNLGTSLKLDKMFVEKLYKLIHDESIRSQTEIMKKNNTGNKT